MPRPIVEIAVDTLADALAAAEAGADRVELSTELACHGLTASPRTLAEFRMASTLPVAALVRPRAGDFVPSPSDHVLAPRQAEALLAAGADAIVFGFLRPDNSVDTDLCARLVRVAGAAETVFHRAFDLVPDPLAAIDQLVDLGVRRILTAGHSPTHAAHVLGLPADPYTPDSLDIRFLALRRYAEHAEGRIEILPCGGVRAENAVRFITETGATQLHSACRAPGGASLDRSQLTELMSAVRSA
jgi:copper homeostasis protein